MFKKKQELIFGTIVTITAECFHKGAKAIILDKINNTYKLGLLVDSKIVHEIRLVRTGVC